MTEQTQNVEGYDLSNRNYTGANVLQLRLDTEPILRRVERYLSGIEHVEVQDKNGDWSVQAVKKSKSRMNDQGINNLMGWLESSVNSQTVQGNYDDERLESFIVRFHSDLAVMLFVNINRWEIDESDYNSLVDFVMNIVEPFYTRLLYNKERESYSETLKHSESATVQNKGGLSIFN